MSLADEVASLESGRFATLTTCVNFKDVCKECNYWDKSQIDSYRCACIGQCPGVTLSKKLKDYILRSLDE